MSPCEFIGINCGDFTVTNRVNSAQRNVLHRVMYSKEIAYSWSFNPVLDGPITAYDSAVKLDVPEDTRKWTLLKEYIPVSRPCDAAFHKANLTCIHGMTVAFHRHQFHSGQQCFNYTTAYYGIGRGQEWFGLQGLDVMGG
jgi:hypothetical protein